MIIGREMSLSVVVVVVVYYLACLAYYFHIASTRRHIQKGAVQ